MTAASVVTTLSMMAPTKKPSSRWKTAPQTGQWCRTRKGDWKTERWPHAGQRSRAPRASVLTIERSALPKLFLR